MKNFDLAILRDWCKKYRAVLLVILAGLILLLLPTEARDETERTGTEISDIKSGEEEIHALEERLERVLKRIEGVGEVEVLLSIESSTRQVWAQDGSREQNETQIREERSTVVISQGGGQESPLPIQRLSPQFRGALVVCSGGDEPGVRLALTEAISSVTGLGADRISICKGK